MLKITNEMIELYDKKVFFIAKKYSNNHNLEDLISAGRLGLMKASKNYDENKNVKFSTFCEKYILGEILEYIRNDKNIKVSRDFIKIKKKIDVAISNFYEKKNKYPTVEEISYIIGEPKERIIDILNTNQNVCSFEEKINDNDDILLKDTISKKEDIDQIDLLCLKNALNELSLEDKKIIKERYYNGKTQSELASEMNTTQVKVYRMERKILDELNIKMAS